MASYKDEQGGQDTKETRQGLNTYEEGEGSPSSTEEMQASQENHVEKASTQTTTGNAQKSKGGLLHRARNALFGPKKQKTKGGGLFSFLTGGGAGGVIAGNNILQAIAKPKVLAILVMIGSVLGFSVLGIFTTYKNDGVTRNDPSLRCEQGELELPKGGEAAENDVQENVNIMYDIFCNQFGYPVNFLKGMLACMGVESGIDPARLESDFILTDEKETFVSIAGPDTGASADVTKNAYWDYGVAFQAGGGWNGNSFYIVDGHMCCGIGLIQWTAGRAIQLIEGIDKVTQDVSVFDLEYQCAFLLAEMKTTYTDFSPDNAGGVSGFDTPEDGVKTFFQYMVSGGSLNNVDERLARLDHYDGSSGPGVNELVDNAVANSEFTEDTVSMAEILADDSFTSAVKKSSVIQLCTNKHYMDVSDIAKAAVSISFIEGGDYKDVHGAYGEYRRDARSPLIINDWDYVEGMNNDTGSFHPEMRVKIDDDGTDGQPTYKNESSGYPGKLDLIACTEYYYFAHLIAFPQEVGTAGQAGYFSSCDRGTGTAVRIAGADDKFPAGNPKYQLKWAVGGAKKGAKHDPDARVAGQGGGALWEFAGFFRGDDLYPASASSKISPGTVMISWSVEAANGMLDGVSGGATAGTTTDAGGVETPDSDSADDTPVPDDPANPDASIAAQEAAMAMANLRWPMSNANTTRHIMTYVGESTVEAFWGMEWLFKQYRTFGANTDLTPTGADPASDLIKGDFDVNIPQIMKDGLSYKTFFAKYASNQRYTFLEAQSLGAKTNDDKKQDTATGREVEYNMKTGLPEFKSWEEIFVRLIHNTDDDAAAKTAEGNDLFYEYDEEKDNYYDDAEDLIEQYQELQARANKSFAEDWNSVGAGDDVKRNGEDDYKGVTSDELLWKDDGYNRKWTMENSAGTDDYAYWRYELVTDIEYRMNQFMRFAMASLMCSLPSEEDADVWQLGEGGSNDTGHVIGNVYRRYSRIPDETDISGRYYYYNTVVSNDLLQDLTQLWSIERNGVPDGVANNGGGDYTARNFGPMYLFKRVGSGMDGYEDTMMQLTTAGDSSRLDRRYGLTAADIKEIMEGVGGLRMGVDAEGANEIFHKYITMPMHAINDAQKALYDRAAHSNSVTDGRGAHEGDHVFNDRYYENEIYGLNPFLMIESENGYSDPLGLVQGMEKWDVDSKGSGSARNSVDDGTSGSGNGVDGDSDRLDDRLAWIDRHYILGENYNINMLAYMVAGLNPSTGKQVSGGKGGWEAALKNTSTLKAEASGVNRDNPNGNPDKLYSSLGLIRYTDYIYGETTHDNQEMSKRLLGTDHRQAGETETDVRDDYNRREWILIPYYHTHAQYCSHDRRLEDIGYDLKCNWCNDDATLSPGDSHKIDTQTYLNSLGWENDWGDTVAFSGYIDLRGKYNMSNIIGYNNPLTKYYDENGTEIVLGSDFPPGHVTCGGHETKACDCAVGSECDPSTCSCGVEVTVDDGPDGIPGTGDESTDWECQCADVTCPICGKVVGCGDEPCKHTCDDCLSRGATAHAAEHHECDGGGDGTADDCHEKYGCNILEYMYHNGKTVYMAIPVVEHPTEDFDINNWKVGGVIVPDKANLLQAVQYDTNGIVDETWSGLVNGGSQSLTNPTMLGTSGLTYLPSKVSYDECYWNDCSSTDKAVGYCASGRQGLLGYFTIEGDVIRNGGGGEDAETISDVSKNCVPSDLQRVESLRNRMGYGKAAEQSVNGTVIGVHQKALLFRTGLEEVKFDRSDHGEPGVVTDYGYGEVQVVGTQHGLDPTDSAGGYGMNDVCGPDGYKGNLKSPFGRSLLREIIGDEHVFHVTYYSQDPAGLTLDVDNGRDFMYYTGYWDPEKKQMSPAKSQPKLFIDHLTGEPTGEMFSADGYVNMPNPAYDMPDSVPAYGMAVEDLRSGTDWWSGWDHDASEPFERTDGLTEYYNSETGEVEAMDDTTYGSLDADAQSKYTKVEATAVFRTVDEDEKYMVPVTEEITDKKYSDPITYKPTDDAQDEFGNDNVENVKLYQGDNCNWITHASRGNRGMMTQYLNLHGMFKKVHDNDASESSKTACYMLFTVINRKDNNEHSKKEQGWPTGSGDKDRDGDLKEGFVYGDPPGDAVEMDPEYVWGYGSVEITDDDGNVIGYKPTNFSDTYGQGDNSHWHNLIELYNAAMSESRHQE